MGPTNYKCQKPVLGGYRHGLEASLRPNKNLARWLCAVYPSPTQMAELHKASEMKTEELSISAAGQLSFNLPPYAVGIVRFTDASY